MLMLNNPSFTPTCLPCSSVRIGTFPHSPAPASHGGHAWHRSVIGCLRGCAVVALRPPVWSILRVDSWHRSTALAPGHAACSQTAARQPFGRRAVAGTWGSCNFSGRWSRGHCVSSVGPSSHRRHGSARPVARRRSSRPRRRPAAHSCPSFPGTRCSRSSVPVGARSCTGPARRTWTERWRSS